MAGVQNDHAAKLEQLHDAIAIKRIQLQNDSLSSDERNRIQEALNSNLVDLHGFGGDLPATITNLGPSSLPPATSLTSMHAAAGGGGGGGTPFRIDAMEVDTIENASSAASASNTNGPISAQSHDQVAHDWLEDLYQALPPVVSDRLSSVYDHYIQERVESTTDLFVLVCGRPGTAKSSLINAVIGVKDLLVTSASRQTSTLVPTRIRRATDGQWSLRLVFRNKDEWHRILREAAKALGDSVAALVREHQDDGQASAIRYCLEEEQSINILRAAHAVLNPACFDTLRLLHPLLGGHADASSSWTPDIAASHLHAVLQWNGGPTSIPAFLEDHQPWQLEQTLTGLSAEQVHLLLELLCQSHTLKADVLQHSLARRLLGPNPISLEQCLEIWTHACQTASFGASARLQRKGGAFLRDTSALADSLRARGVALSLPETFFNIWPILQFVEVAGPVSLPLRVVLVDSAGAQDEQHITSPIDAAMASLPRPPSRIWHTIKAERNATQSSDIEHVLAVGSRVGWSKLSVLYTRCDDGEKHERRLNITSCRSSIEQKLMRQQQANAETVAANIPVHETSTHFHWASQRTSIGEIRQDLSLPTLERWELDDEDLAENITRVLGEFAGVEELHLELQGIARSDAIFAESVRQQHGRLLELHIQAVAHSSGMIEGLSEVMRSGQQLLEPLTTIVRTDIAFEEGARSNLQSQLRSRLLTSAPDPLTSLQDLHPAHLPGLVERNGKLVANLRSKAGVKNYHVARCVAEIFSESIPPEPFQHPLILQLQALLATRLHSFEERYLELIQQQSADLGESDPKRALLDYLRNVLRAEVATAIRTRELDDLLQSTPDFATALWGHSIHREVWNQLWQSITIPGPAGTTRNKVEAIVQEIADRAPERLLGIYGQVIVAHLQKCEREVFDYLQMSFTNIGERLAEAAEPLVLDSASQAQCSAVLRRLRQALGAVASSSSSAAAAAASTAPGSRRNEHPEAAETLDDRASKRVRTSETEWAAAIASPRAATAEVQSDAAAASSSVASVPVMAPLAAASSSSSSLVPSEPATYTLPGGPRCCIFFRGLCAAQQVQTLHTVDLLPSEIVESALVAPIDQVFRQAEYQQVSSFVAIEDMLRAQADAEYAARSLPHRVSQLGQQVREDMLSITTRSFRQLAESVNVRPDQCDSKSLAYYPTPNVFENFRFATQQVYSNNDLRFMQSFADVSADITQHALPQCEPNVAAVVDRVSAVKAKASSKDRWRFLRLEAWRWMGHPIYKLPRHPLAGSLHGNPYVSVTDNMQHALRYTTGLKKYMQGKHQQQARPLRYGWNEATKQYDSFLSHRVPAGDNGLLIGVLMLLFVPFEEYQNGVHLGYCNNISLLHGERKVSIDPRIKQEREVTFLGFIPSMRTFRWELPILNLDDAEGWHTFYGVSRTDRQFLDLEAAVTALVQARINVRVQAEQLTIVQNKEDNVRRALLRCIQLKMQQDLLRDLPGLSLDFRQ